MDKLEEIENIVLENTRNQKRILTLSNDVDEEVRYRAIESFEMFKPEKELILRLREGLTDNDELVRCISSEMLGIWKDEESIEYLKKAAYDESDIVRSAAIVSLICIDIRQLDVFLAKLLPSLSGVAKVPGLIAMYLLGNPSFFKEIISLIKTSPDHIVRCSAVNHLGRFIIEKDKKEFLLELKNHLENEKSKAVISSIEGTINALEK